MAKKEKPPKPAPAEGAEAGEGAEGAPAKKKPPILLIAIAGGVLLLGGGGAGAFFLLKPKPPAAEAGHADPKAEKAKAEKKKPKKEGKEGEKSDKPGATITEGPDGVVFYSLPNLVVNIQSPDGRPTFLKLKLTLELPDADEAEEVEPNMPRLNDMFTTFLRELRPEDLSGSQGSYQLRMEILRRVNLVLAPAKVNAVLIEEMLVQ